MRGEVQPALKQLEAITKATLAPGGLAFVTYEVPWASPRNIKIPDVHIGLGIK